MDPLQGEVETFPDNMDVAMSQGGGVVRRCIVQTMDQITNMHRCLVHTN